MWDIASTLFSAERISSANIGFSPFFILIKSICFFSASDSASRAAVIAGALFKSSSRFSLDFSAASARLLYAIVAPAIASPIAIKANPQGVRLNAVITILNLAAAVSAALKLVITPAIPEAKEPRPDKTAIPPIAAITLRNVSP